MGKGVRGKVWQTEKHCQNQGRWAKITFPHLEEREGWSSKASVRPKNVDRSCSSRLFKSHLCLLPKTVLRHSHFIWGLEFEGTKTLPSGTHSFYKLVNLCPKASVTWPRSPVSRDLKPSWNSGFLAGLNYCHCPSLSRGSEWSFNWFFFFS